MQMAFYDYQLFGVDSFDKMLTFVYEDVRQFCKAKGLDLHMNALTKNALGLARSTDFPAGPLVLYSRLFLVVRSLHLN